MSFIDQKRDNQPSPVHVRLGCEMKNLQLWWNFFDDGFPARVIEIISFSASCWCWSLNLCDIRNPIPMRSRIDVGMLKFWIVCFPSGMFVKSRSGKLPADGSIRNLFHLHFTSYPKRIDVLSFLKAMSSDPLCSKNVDDTKWVFDFLRTEDLKFWNI